MSEPAAPILIVTPTPAPFIPSSAADPALRRGARVAHVHTADLFGELKDPDAPFLHTTMRELRAQSAAPFRVATLTIGYMSRYQDQLARSISRPVVSSPLLALPTLVAALPTDHKILVVYADSDAAVPQDIPGLTEEQQQRHLLLVGLQGPGPFRRAVFDRTEPFDHHAVSLQIAAVIEKARRDEKISAVLLECGEMAAVAGELRAAYDLPIVDYHLMIDFFVGATTASPPASTARYTNQP